MSSPANKLDSADELSIKLDRCLTDGIIKLGGGALIGTVASLLFLKRKRWPIISGAGIGLGIAYAHCEYELNPRIDKQFKTSACKDC